MAYGQLEKCANKETICPQGTISDSSGSTSCRLLTPTEQTLNFIGTVNGMHLDHGVKISLDAKLYVALFSLYIGNNHSAVNQLNAFINEVNAQSGKHLTVEQAQLLDSFAKEIINAIK